ncbi:Diphthine methyltransferase-like protein [Bienertia sinuspersici]
MDLGHWFLEGNTDAVEFCPHDGFQNILAVATYNLQEGDPPSRFGSISLFDVNSKSRSLNRVGNVETAGIFDMKWNPIGGGASPVLAQADADGCLRVHELECSSNEINLTEASLKENCGVQISSSMCLWLDWNPLATSLAVGLSDGCVSITSLAESQLIEDQQWKAHDFEVWTAIFDTHQPAVVYTGSDDCKFLGWDLRADSSMPVFQNSKAHTMGVCCIVKNPNDPYSLLTGSYDERLRVWDVRSISKPVNEASISLGGGVWRIKYHPFVKDLVLAACMHNGFSIVKINNEILEVIETYNKHDSLAYGADWQRSVPDQEGKREDNAVATCSFYDRLLRVWIPEADILA